MDSAAIETQIHLRGLTEREAVMDAVFRVLQGLDDANQSLLQSAFTHDAVLDLGGTTDIGTALGTHKGHAAVVDFLTANVANGMDTMHNVSNFRVDIDGDRASLTAYAIAQHYRPGEAVQPLDSKWLMMGNRYVSTLRKEDGLWKIEYFLINTRWCDGDIGVMQHLKASGS